MVENGRMCLDRAVGAEMVLFSLHHHFYVLRGQVVRASFPPVMGHSAPGKDDSSVATAYERQMAVLFLFWKGELVLVWVFFCKL